MKYLVIALLITATSFTFKSSTTFKPLSDEANRKRITNAILDNLVKENYEDVRKDFHSTLKANLTVEKISEVWAAVVNTNGAFEKISNTTVAEVQGFNQVKLRCQFKNENATLETTF